MRGVKNKIGHKITRSGYSTKIFGWVNMFQGRMSIKWRELYNHDLKNNKIDQRQIKVEKWGTDLLLILWKLVYEC